MPPVVTGKRYAFTTSAGRLEAELVEVGDEWLTVKLPKGDRAWFRLSSLTAVAETENAHSQKKRTADPVSWTEGGA